jgi:hypothetical protein
LWERTREGMIEKRGRNIVQKTSTLRERRTLIPLKTKLMVRGMR